MKRNSGESHYGCATCKFCNNGLAVALDGTTQIVRELPTLVEADLELVPVDALRSPEEQYPHFDSVPNFDGTPESAVVLRSNPNRIRGS